MPKPVMLCWSGGKDSSVTLQTLLDDPEWNVVGLLTTVNSEYQRIVMHGVREELLDAQADALGLPLHKLYLPAAPDNSVYESVMGNAMRSFMQQGIRHFAFGDLHLQDVKAYREKQLQQVGATGVYPIWQKPVKQVANGFIEDGFKAVLVCIDGQQMAMDFCGAEYDHALLDALPATVDPCGENGEFHSFVYDGPVFSQPVQFSRGEQVTREERFRYQELLPR